MAHAAKRSVEDASFSIKNTTEHKARTDSYQPSPNEVLEAHIYRFLLDRGLTELAVLCRFHFHGGLEYTMACLRCPLQDLIPPFALQSSANSTSICAPPAKSASQHQRDVVTSQLREKRSRIHSAQNEEHSAVRDTAKSGKDRCDAGSYQTVTKKKKRSHHPLPLHPEHIHREEAVPSRGTRPLPHHGSSKSHANGTKMTSAKTQRRLHRTGQEEEMGEGEATADSWANGDGSMMPPVGVKPADAVGSDALTGRSSWDENRPLFYKFQKRKTKKRSPPE